MIQQVKRSRSRKKGLSLSGIGKELQSAMHILALELGRPVAAIGTEAVVQYLKKHNRLPKGWQ